MSSSPHPPPRPPLVGEALAAGTGRIREGAPEEARLNVEWLLCRLVGCPRLELPLRRGRRLTPDQARRFGEGIDRLARGEPLAYVLGEAEFMGRPFRCDRRGLVPRPETEQLAEWMLDWAPLWKRPSPVMADVGTGSGCLAVTLALERPAARILALDISPEALALAQSNATRHGVTDRIRLLETDLLAGLPPDSLDAVVSNPPYVATADWERCPRTVRDFEPRAALDGGPDGLAVICRLVKQARATLAPGGALFLEIGDTQGTAVRALLEAAGFQGIRIRPDLAGKDRLARAIRPASDPDLTMTKNN